MSDQHSPPIRNLLNLGPKSAEMLVRTGICDFDELRRLGAVQAYLRVAAVWPGASLNLLYALEGAITGEHWTRIAHRDKARLLTEIEGARLQNQLFVGGESCE